MDTRLIRTPRYYGQFALSLGKQSPYIFPQFNPLNTDTSLYYTQFALSLGKESPYIFSQFNPLNADPSLLRTVWLVHDIPSE